MSGHEYEYSYINITTGEGIPAEDDQEGLKAVRYWAQADAEEGRGLFMFPADAPLPSSVANLLNDLHKHVREVLEELRKQYPERRPTPEAMQRRRQRDEEERRFWGLDSDDSELSLSVPEAAESRHE